MAIRDKLVSLADEFWEKAEEATERKSYIEANTYKHAANRIREVLGMGPLS